MLFLESALFFFTEQVYEGLVQKPSAKRPKTAKIKRIGYRFLLCVQKPPKNGIGEGGRGKPSSPWFLLIIKGLEGFFSLLREGEGEVFFLMVFKAQNHRFCCFLCFAQKRSDGRPFLKTSLPSGGF